jgi:hypothetical protein
MTKIYIYKLLPIKIFNSLICLLVFIASSSCSPVAEDTQVEVESLQATSFAVAELATVEKEHFSQTLSVLAPTLDLLKLTSTPTSTPTSSHTDTPPPTATVTFPDPVLDVSKTIIIVDNERTVLFTFINNDSQISIQGSQYQISLYDKTESLVQAAVGTIDLILANSTILLVDTVLTPRKSQYAPRVYGLQRAEVQFKAGHPITLEFDIPPDSLNSLNVSYNERETYAKVNGEIKSDLDFELLWTPVAVAIFDNENSLIGGGLTYIPFIPAGESAPFEIGMVRIQQEYDRIEIFPQINLFSLPTQ